MSDTGKDNPKIKEWEAKFNHAFERKKGEWEALSNSKDSRSYYTLGYWIDALTAMFEATGAIKYLRQALTYVRSVIKIAVPAPQFKDSHLYRGWLSTVKDEDRETPLYESCMWRYVTKILRLIKETPSLFDDPDCRDFFQKVLPFTEKHIWEKWYNRGKNRQYIYRSRTHMASHWAFIAVNMLKVSTDETKKSQYREVISKIDNDLRENFHPAGQDADAYSWNATWDTDDSETEVQDVSHGNHVISYITEAFQQAASWNAQDIAGLANTLKNILWDSAKREFFDFLDGTYGKVHGYEHTGRRQADGWVKLGRFDREIQQIYETYLKDNPDAVTFANQEAQFYANMALNEKILNEKKLDKKELDEEKLISKLIRLTSPVGGETLEAGERHPITWIDKEFAGTVEIDYSVDNGDSWENIASRTRNDGRRNWKVPVVKSNRCLVRIRRTDGSAEDVTGEVFSIAVDETVLARKLIWLTSPEGGETLEAGKRHRITWLDKTFEGTVDIDYSIDNGDSWENIASRTRNDGRRFWKIPENIDSNRCLVRVRRSDGSAEDVCGGVFSIVKS